MNWFGSSKERFKWWSHELVGFRIFDVFDRFSFVFVFAIHPGKWGKTQEKIQFLRLWVTL